MPAFSRRAQHKTTQSRHCQSSPRPRSPAANSLTLTSLISLLWTPQKLHAQRDKAAHAYPSRHTDTHERGHSSGREVVTIGHRDSHISRWRLIHSQHVTAGLTIQKTPRTASPPHRTLETPIKTAGDPAVPAPVQFSNYHTLPIHLTATTSTTNQALLNTTKPNSSRRTSQSMSSQKSDLPIRSNGHSTAPHAAVQDLGEHKSFDVDPYASPAIYYGESHGPRKPQKTRTFSSVSSLPLKPAHG
jgi:hypothetical protein